MHAAVSPAETHPLPLDAAGLVHLDVAACLRLRSGAEACHACGSACPNGSLSLGASLTVSEACLGCGRCAAICPTGALAVRGFDDLLPSPNGNVVTVECFKVPVSIAGHHALRVPCTGGIQPSRWLELTASAVPRSVAIMDRGWCHRCEANACIPRYPALDALEPVEVLLDEIGWKESEWPHIHRDPLPAALMPATIPDVRPEQPARRGLFRRMRDETRRAIGEAPREPESSPRSLREHAMRMPERERFLGLARRLARKLETPVPAFPFVAIQVGSNCNNHQLCARLCPTGALATYAQDNRSGLRFDADICTGCGLCAKHCPERAIRLLPAASPPVGQIMLTAFAERSCRRCQRLFSGAEGRHTCPSCTLAQGLGQALFGRGMPLAEESTDIVPVSPSGGAHHE